MAEGAPVSGRGPLRVPTLWISGPVGVGKTTVGYEVSTLLERAGVHHTFVELDVLAQTYPSPPGDRFQTRLATAILRDLWRHALAAGSRNLVMARVLETAGGLDRMRAVLPGNDIFVVQLRASAETLVARVGAREIGLGYEWHAARAVELIDILDRAPADARIDTDGRSVVDIAHEIVGLVAWQ